MALTRHSNRGIALSAISALKNFSDPVVREFALQSIQLGIHPGRMLGLLERNFKDGDWHLIETLTGSLDDNDENHMVGFSVHDILQEHSSPEAIPALLNSYEHDPCDYCRERIVEDLHSLNAVPSWIIEECQYDANFDLRALVNNLRT